jgi:hypothetical protein
MAANDNKVRRGVLDTPGDTRARLMWYALVAAALLAGLLAGAFMRPSLRPALLFTVAGATFTAGGLIIATVAVFTMQQLDRVARESAESALTTAQAAFSRQVQGYVANYIAYFNAIQNGALDDAARVVSEVEDAPDPEMRMPMPGAGLNLAALYLRQVVRAFYLAHRWMPTKTDSVLPSVLKAQTWVRRCIAAGEGGSLPHLWAAILCAYVEDETGMLEALETFLRTDETSPINTLNAMMFASAVHAEERALATLSSRLNDRTDPFPWTRAQLNAEVQRITENHPAWVDLWVVRRPDGRLTPFPDGLAVIRLVVEPKGESFCEWHVVRNGLYQLHAFPPLTREGRDMTTGTPNFVPVERIVQDLYESVWILAREDVLDLGVS